MDKYYYLRYLFGKGYAQESADVQIVGESPKRYKIRLQNSWVGRHPPGSELWVSKNKVRVEKPPVDLSEQWWQN
jgi:hypothetical protein